MLSAATLEEVTEADVLLHVVDLCHPAWRSHISSVKEILAQMPIAPGPMLMSFNKIDGVDGETLAAAKTEFPNAAFIAARERLGLVTLRQKLAQFIVDS